MSPSSEPPLLNGHAHKATESEPQKWDYSQPGSTGYSIPQNTTWRDPNNRKLRVLTIGAGISGILIAYQIQKQCSMVEHVVYEKNSDIGGTWLENRYPRAGCDIPSHAYTYQFALNPDWPRFFSYASEIQDYLNKVCEVFSLRKYMNFHTRVIGCFWMEEEGEWLVKLRREAPGEEPREFEDRCHLLLHGAGILNNWKWPNVAGLHDRFQGRVIHTANWPESYQKEQWANETVAVLGSGASSVQTVPGMQPFAKKLEVFVRTGIWFGILAGNFGHNKEYGLEEREEFHKDPIALVRHAKDIEGQVNGLWGGFYSETKAQAMATGFFRKRMAEKIKDERLLKGLTPQFGLGCRRITPGDPYIEAIQQDNVEVHFTAVERCTEDGVVGEDGVERKVDTIVCATGFDVSYRPSFPIVGKKGSELAKKWAQRPEGYLGVAVPDFPNFLTFMGPTWPIQNGSVMAPLHTVSEYAVQVIKKMQNENIKSLTPKQGVTDKFNEHAQEWIKHTVYKESCRAWYKDHDTGRVNAIWPGSSLHYQQVLETPRYEDFDIEHFDDNPWACLGMGWTMQDRLGPKEADVCPYLSLENIDPQWLEACGGDVEVWKQQLASGRGTNDCYGGSATPALA